MTPVNQCLRKVGHVSAGVDPTTVKRVCEALDELERAYRRPSERIVALEAVLHDFGRYASVNDTPFRRFLRISVERRQNKWARHI
ncbi:MULTISPECIES: hypothetical protein [unclassified Methylobacterium]|uniref:hypothetical protein n=1 Tax=unclassified Methylobacterium TaxID=2615210 RepID=UPI003702AEAC